MTSLLRRLRDWLSQKGPHALKHQRLWHPLFTVLLHYTVAATVTFLANQRLSQWFDNNTVHVPPPLLNTQRARAIAVFLWIYALFVVLFRCLVVARYQSRSQSKSSAKTNDSHNKRTRSQLPPATACNLYSSTFLCNVTLVMGPLGLFLMHHDDPYYYRRITQAHCIAVGIDQLLWGVDLSLGLATAGRWFPIGLSKYLFTRNVHWMDWVTPWHHLFTIPLLLCHDGMNMPDVSPYLLSLVVIAINVTMSRWLTPISVTFACSDDPSVTKTMYLNVNLAHELWTDVEIPMLQVVNRYKHKAVSYVFALLWRWAFFNLLVFWVLKHALFIVKK